MFLKEVFKTYWENNAFFMANNEWIHSLKRLNYPETYYDLTMDCNHWNSSFSYIVLNEVYYKGIYNMTVL